MLFLFVLGGSRLAIATSEPAPSKQLRTFTVLIHVFEVLFFHLEAMDQREPLRTDQKAFLAILWGLPYLLLTKVPSV
jgi:hypothetical protein